MCKDTKMLYEENTARITVGMAAAVEQK